MQLMRSEAAWPAGLEAQTHPSRHLRHASPSSPPRLRLTLLTPVIFLFEEDEGAHKSRSLFHHTGFILRGRPMGHGSKARAEAADLWLAGCWPRCTTLINSQPTDTQVLQPQVMKPQRNKGQQIFKSVVHLTPPHTKAQHCNPFGCGRAAVASR